MLEALKTEWANLQERQAPASELAQFYSEAVTTIRDQIITDFFIQEEVNIRALLEQAGTQECELRSLDFPYKEMSEYEVGVGEYIHSMMEKANDETFDEDEWFADLHKVQDNSFSFVEQLFADELNPCHRVPIEEAASCLESLMDLQMQCTAMLEAGDTLSQEIGSCEDQERQDALRGLYFGTETRFLLEYTDQCLQTYGKLQKILSGEVTEPEGIQFL